MKVKQLIFLLACSFSATIAAQTTFPAFPPEDVTAWMDRDQMMMQLGISFPQLVPEDQDPNRPAHIRRIPEGESFSGQWTDDVGYFPDSPRKYLINRGGFGLWLNYIEEPDKVGVYTPIDLLKTMDGKPVKTPKDWWNKRRPELEKACKEEIWGVIPQAAADLKVTWEDRLLYVADSIYGSFEVRQLTGAVDVSSYPAIKHRPMIQGKLYLPVGASEVPVIIQYAWMRYPPHPIYVRECISRGWAFLQMDCVELQPDNGAFLTDYLIGLVNKGNWRQPQDWGALAAWSWGVSRLIDYFEKDTRMDATRVGVTGHSRYGKATLVTMAYEPRVAVSYVSCSGAAGAAPIRRHMGQNLESIVVETEYQWLAGNFMKWCSPLEEGGYLPRRYEKLPVDAHALLALCAPRPVFIGGGTTDSWCDAYGTYLTTRDASPAYELLGAKGLQMPDADPIPDKGYMDGALAYRLHVGWHVDFLDWPYFAEFAERIFNK